jgi:hypothetical protein
MKDKTEAKIQQEIFMFAVNNYCLKHHSPRCVFFSVPNDSNSKEETMRKLATGMKPGASDFIFIMPSRCLFFEVKIKTGKQSDNQIEFEQQVKALGFEYYLVRSLEEFKNIINVK